MQIKRRFIIGDEWLYLKIYSGPKTLEEILINEIYELIISLHEEKLVDKFFFIKYKDNDYHLRLRFHLTSKLYTGNVIDKLNKILDYYIRNNLIWDILLGTYNREFERYGESSYIYVESIFSFDSWVIIKYLKQINENLDEENRWLYAIKTMDYILNKFKLSMQEKHTIHKLYFEAYSKEFVTGQYFNKQINNIYRSKVNLIESTLATKDYRLIKSENLFFEEMMDQSVQKVIDLNIHKRLEVDYFSLIQSIIHMHYNRFFRTRQREYEYLIYYFLSKYYFSLMCRSEKLNAI